MKLDAFCGVNRGTCGGCTAEEVMHLGGVIHASEA